MDLLDVAPPAALVADCEALDAILDAPAALDVTTPPSADVLEAAALFTSALFEARALCSAALFEATKPEFEARKAEAEDSAAGSRVRLERVARAPGMSTLLGRETPSWDAAAETWWGLLVLGDEIWGRGGGGDLPVLGRWFGR